MKSFGKTFHGLTLALLISTVLVPFTMAEPTPEVKTQNVLLTEDEAVLYGDLGNVSAEEMEETSFNVFFRWGKGIENIEHQTSKESISEPDEFVETITDLEPETIYTYQAAVQWNENKSTGSIKHFTTGDFIGNKITVKTLDAENVSYSSAKLTGEITELDFQEGELFFRWAKEGENLFQETGGQSFSETGKFEREVNELEPDTSYEFEIVAEVEGNQEPGNKTTFHTEVPHAEIKAPSPGDGEKDMGTKLKLSFNLSLPVGGKADVRFYEGSNGPIIDEVKETEGGKVSTTWNGLNYTEKYDWYVEVDYRNRTVESERWSFSTTNQTRIKNIEDRIKKMETTIQEADTWLDENNKEVDTSILENSLKELKDLHGEAEKAVESGNYNKAEEKLDEAEVFEKEVDKQLQMLEEASKEFSSLWIVVVIIVLVTIGIVAVFIFTYQKSSGSRDYETIEKLEKPEDKYEELMKETEKE